MGRRPNVKLLMTFAYLLMSVVGDAEAAPKLHSPAKLTKPKPVVLVNESGVILITDPDDAAQTFKRHAHFEYGDIAKYIGDDVPADLRQDLMRWMNNNKKLVIDTAADEFKRGYPKNSKDCKTDEQVGNDVGAYVAGTIRKLSGLEDLVPAVADLPPGG